MDKVSLPQDEKYSARRTFVLEFSAETEGTCSGRVEHIVTGKRHDFHSMEELLNFMHDALTQATHLRRVE